MPLLRASLRPYETTCHKNADFPLTGLATMKLALRISLLMLTVGCVRAEVQPLDQVVRPVRSTDSILVFEQDPPQRHYKVIATIEVRGETVFDDFGDLRSRLIEEAAKLGGDAVILGPKETPATFIILPTGLFRSETREIAAEVIVFER